MSKKVTKLVGLSLVLVLLSVLVLVLSASGNDDEALSDGYEVIWQGDGEPDANLKVELMM